MKLLVCGGRDFNDKPLVARVLDEIHAKHQPLIVIEGGATGADREARLWAFSRGVHVATVEANWTKSRLTGGPLRNAAMLLLEPDLVVAFPGGRGTKDMVDRARGLRIPVRQVSAATMAAPEVSDV